MQILNFAPKFSSYISELPYLRIGAHVAAALLIHLRGWIRLSLRQGQRGELVVQRLKISIFKNIKKKTKWIFLSGFFITYSVTSQNLTISKNRVNDNFLYCLVVHPSKA